MDPTTISRNVQPIQLCRATAGSGTLHETHGGGAGSASCLADGHSWGSNVASNLSMIIAPDLDLEPVEIFQNA